MRRNETRADDAQKAKHSSSETLLAEESAHTLENAVLLRVVGMIFAGDFENGGEGVGEGVYAVANALGNL